MFTMFTMSHGVNVAKKTETVGFRADAGMCADLDRERGALTRSAFVREIVESGLRLRQCALKPWVGKGSSGRSLGKGNAVGVDRSSF